MSRMVRVGWLVAVLGVLPGSAAAGDRVGARVAEARAEFRAARRAYEQGRVEEAHRLYRRAARPPEGTPELQRRAAARVNHHRMHAMVPPVIPDPRLALAARAHASYLQRNVPDGQVQLSRAHHEEEGRPGYTGRSSADRMQAQGLEGGSLEVISWDETEPEAAVDHLMNTVYHRGGLLRPEAQLLGFGAARDAVIQLAWARGNQAEVAWSHYPGPGQEDVPPRFPGQELPDPLPGARYPVGPPLSVTGEGHPPRVLRAALRGPKGEVPLRVLRRGTAPHPELLGDHVFLMPMRPLEPGEEYEAEVSMKVGRRRVRRTWAFRTGDTVPGETEVRLGIQGFAYHPVNPRPGQTVRFRAEVAAPEGSAVHLRWSVDDRVLQDGPPAPFSWTVPRAGHHRVQAVAYPEDRGGAFARKEVILSVPARDGRVPGGQPPPAPLPPMSREDVESMTARFTSFEVDRQLVNPGEPVRFEAALEASHPDQVRLRWSVDGEIVHEGPEQAYTWEAEDPGTHKVEVHAFYPEVSSAFARRGVFLQVRDPARRSELSKPLGLRFEPPAPWTPGQPVRLVATPLHLAGEVTYTFKVDGRTLGTREENVMTWRADGRHDHRFEVKFRFPGGSATRSVQQVQE